MSSQVSKATRRLENGPDVGWGRFARRLVLSFVALEWVCEPAIETHKYDVLLSGILQGTRVKSAWRPPSVIDQNKNGLPSVDRRAGESVAMTCVRTFPYELTIVSLRGFDCVWLSTPIE